MSVTIGFQLIPQLGDMRPMRDAWVEADALGVDRLYTADHFNAMQINTDVASGNHAQTPGGKNFEATTIQAAMAATTSRAEIGCIVHANSYRNPNLMADIARTIDHISGGRFILGIGSGYLKPDYDDYGYDYGTQKSRLQDLARDVPIIKARFEKLNPKPLRKIPLMIASMGEKIGMRIVAEHADIWHVYGPAEKVREKTEVLKGICQEIGRDFSEIELTTYFFPHLIEKDSDPGVFLELGIKHLIYPTQGPAWDLGPVRELLQWRKSLG